jgi:Family of unknown function (DUF5652)
MDTLQSEIAWLFPVIIILTIWEVIWKIVGMWKSARNNHVAWFICIAVINTIGILPIVYILINRKKSVA